MWTAGLATAYALRKMGHDVLVIEKSEALVKVRVCILSCERNVNQNPHVESRRTSVRHFFCDV
jgi:2-polyprenyl-6-methoxyphenol hydroxylase-like FAD-dependent oxidoreductase